MLTETHEHTVCSCVSALHTVNQPGKRSLNGVNFTSVILKTYIFICQLYNGFYVTTGMCVPTISSCRYLVHCIQLRASHNYDKWY